MKTQKNLSLIRRIGIGAALVAAGMGIGASVSAPIAYKAGEMDTKAKIARFSRWMSDNQLGHANFDLNNGPNRYEIENLSGITRGSGGFGHYTYKNAGWLDFEKSVSQLVKEKPDEYRAIEELAEAANWEIFARYMTEDYSWQYLNYIDRLNREEE